MRPSIAAPLLAAALLVNAVSAGCSGAEIIQGRVHAYCTDEITGVDFEYVDLDGTFLSNMSTLSVKSSVASMRILNNNIYNYYDPNGLNTTDAACSSLANQERATSRKTWQDCRNKVTGICSFDHAIDVGTFASSFISSIVAIISEVNTGRRETKNPRSICWKAKRVSPLNDTRMCVAWSTNNYAELGANQIDAIAIGCEEQCHEFNMACEVVNVAGHTLQHFYVTDRAKGCKLPLGNNFIMCDEEV